MLQFIKTFADNMCVLFFENQNLVEEKYIFHECDKKKMPKKKVFVCSKMPKIAPSNTLKFFWQNVLLFFSHIHEKCLHDHFLIKKNTHIVNKSFSKL